MTRLRLPSNPADSLPALPSLSRVSYLARLVPACPPSPGQLQGLPVCLVLPPCRERGQRGLLRHHRGESVSHAKAPCSPPSGVLVIACLPRHVDGHIVVVCPAFGNDMVCCSLTYVCLWLWGRRARWAATNGQGPGPGPGMLGTPMPPTSTTGGPAGGGQVVVLGRVGVGVCCCCCCCCYLP